MFKLEFETDNAAFEADKAAETAIILRTIANRIQRGLTEGPVYDSNGNKIGWFELELDDEA